MQTNKHNINRRKKSFSQLKSFVAILFLSGLYEFFLFTSAFGWCQKMCYRCYFLQFDCSIMFFSSLVFCRRAQERCRARKKKNSNLHVDFDFFYCYTLFYFFFWSLFDPWFLFWWKNYEQSCVKHGYNQFGVVETLSSFVTKQKIIPKYLSIMHWSIVWISSIVFCMQSQSTNKPNLNAIT